MNIKKILAGSAIAAAVFGSMAVPAFAAKPNNQACLGNDLSSSAQNGAGFGAFIATLAKDEGIGAEIQNHLAGLVPDEVVPNSCND